MPRTTTIVSPYELVKFAEVNYGMDNMAACRLVSWVIPECEVKTYDYELSNLESDVEEEDEDIEPKAKALLIDFLKSMKLKAMTLTQ